MATPKTERSLAGLPPLKTGVGGEVTKAQDPEAKEPDLLKQRMAMIVKWHEAMMAAFELEGLTPALVVRKLKELMGASVGRRPCHSEIRKAISMYMGIAMWMPKVKATQINIGEVAAQGEDPDHPDAIEVDYEEIAAAQERAKAAELAEDDD